MHMSASCAILCVVQNCVLGVDGSDGSKGAHQQFTDGTPLEGKVGL